MLNIRVRASTRVLLILSPLVPLLVRIHFLFTHHSFLAMVWEGKGVVASARKIIGATNPLASEPGTIRGDFFVDVGRNGVHGSDSVESAQREIALWFAESEIFSWSPTMKSWIYE